MKRARLPAPVGYIVRMPDGLTAYHAGDTGVFGGMSLWGELYAIDVALLERFNFKIVYSHKI